VLEPALTGVFPAFHMELVKVPVPSTKSLGPESRGAKRRLGGGTQCSQVTQILSLDLRRMMHCKYASMQSRSGFFSTVGNESCGRKWNPDLGAQLRYKTGFDK